MESTMLGVPRCDPLQSDISDAQWRRQWRGAKRSESRSGVAVASHCASPLPQWRRSGVAVRAPPTAVRSPPNGTVVGV